MSTTKPESTLPETRGTNSPRRKIPGALLKRLLVFFTGIIAVFIAVLIFAGIQPESPDPDSYEESDTGEGQAESTHLSDTGTIEAPKEKQSKKSSQEADRILRDLLVNLRAHPSVKTYGDVATQIDALIPSLDESDKRMLYFAYAAKADCEWFLSRQNKAIASFKNCLELSKNQNDQYPIESAKQFLLLSFAELNRDNRPKAESYASMAMKITGLQNGNGYSLSPPNYYNDLDRAILRSTCEDILANAALERGDYANALKHAKSADLELGSRWKMNFAYCPTTIIADVYLEQGNEKSAKTVVKQSIDLSLQQINSTCKAGSAEESNLVQSCDICADWYLRHNFNEEARLAYKSYVDLARKKKLETWLQQSQLKLKNLAG